VTIPTLAERSRNPDAYLPPSALHPAATGRFRALPTREHAGRVDLGLWNIFANPDYPKPQERIRELLCREAQQGSCTDAVLLELAIARFKTPTVRDLGQSYPYLHDGSLDDIDEVIEFYARMSSVARRGAIRNADARLRRVFLVEQDVQPLSAFLRALNEDYQ
jgi:cytochrome c peroxidase